MTNEKVYIAIKHQDQQNIVQRANSIEQAKKLIAKVMPKLEHGYQYIIIN